LHILFGWRILWQYFLFLLRSFSMQPQHHHQHTLHNQCPRDPILEDTHFSFHFSEPISTIRDSELHDSSHKFAPTGTAPALAIGAMAAQNEEAKSGYTGGRPQMPVSRDSNSSFSHKDGVVCEETATNN